MATKKTKFDTGALKKRVRLEEVLGALGVSLSKSGTDLVGFCPFHDDKNRPSLVVNPKKQLCKCHGPCDEGWDSIGVVAKSVGLKFVDACKWLCDRFNIPIEDVSIVDTSVAVPKKVAEYLYVELDGKLVQAVERWEPGRGAKGGSKSFTQRVPMETAIALFACESAIDGCGAKPGEPCGHESRAAKMNTHQVLYLLPELRAREHEMVFIVEGEKCVHAIRDQLGLLSTTWAGGANQKRLWTKDFAAPLAGRRVVIIPDLNKTKKKTGEMVQSGVEIAKHIASVLEGVAAEVRILTMTFDGAIAKARGDKADIVEWVADGGTKEQLQKLAEGAPVAGAMIAWESTLLRTPREREVRATVGNALKVVENAETFRGAFYFDERALTVHVTRTMPWDRKGVKYPRQLNDDDAVFGAAWCESELRAPISPETFGKAIWANARQNKRNPLADYLKALHWDGTRRCDSWLIRLAQAKDDRFVRAVSEAWLVSAVARAIDPGCQVDHCIVLESEQGKSKSSLLRALAGADYFADHLPDLDSKDAALILGQAWIVEFSELEGLTRSEVTKVKAFVTRRADVFRPPYDRSTIRVPRGCVFSASTNEAQYLTDPTGGRRWWPVTVNRIDVKAALAERDQLWAEAVHLYKNGTQWWFTDEDLVRIAHEETSKRERFDAWEGLLENALEGFVYTTLDTCFKEVGLTDKSRQGSTETKRITQLLHKWKWVRRKVWYRSETGERRRQWRWFSPGNDPGDDIDLPPPTGGTPGGDGGGGTSGGTSQYRGADTPVTPDTPGSRVHAHAHAQESLLPTPTNALSETLESGVSMGVQGASEVPRPFDAAEGGTPPGTPDGLAFVGGDQEASDLIDDTWGGRG